MKKTRIIDEVKLLKNGWFTKNSIIRFEIRLDCDFFYFKLFFNFIFFWILFYKIKFILNRPEIRHRVWRTKRRIMRPRRPKQRMIMANFGLLIQQQRLNFRENFTRVIEHVINEFSIFRYKNFDFHWNKLCKHITGECDC